MRRKSMTANTDPRLGLRRAFEQAALVVRGVSPDHLARPTPCSEFDVSDLLAHLVGVGNRIAGIGHDEEQPDELQTVSGLAAEAWSAAFDNVMSEALEAWSDDTLLERDLVLPFGTFPGPLVVQIYVLELVTHSWDLAVATEQTSVLNPALAEAALPVAAAMLPPEPRGGEMPFGHVVAVAGDRPAYDRLAGYLGRRPA
jgi:uncharacterized protein (TIGR03086 family)